MMHYEPLFLITRAQFSLTPSFFGHPDPLFIVTPNEVRGSPFSLSLPQGDFSLTLEKTR